MNSYKKLYQQIIELKEKLEMQQKELDSGIATNKNGLKKAESEIEDLERKKNNKNYIYSTLINYKTFIIEKLKLYIKVGSAVTAILALILLIAGLAISASFIDILLAIGAAVVIGATAGVINFLDDTKEERNIHKRYNGMLYAFPAMIMSLDNQICVEHQIVDDYKEKLEKLDDEKNIVLSYSLAKCDEALKRLDSFMMEVAFICRDDIEAINDVFDNDIEVQDVMKLIRENNIK